MRERRLAPYNPIPTEEISKKELNFRREAKLCMRCGAARPAAPTDTLCYDCCEALDIQLIHHRWKIWGIAA